MNIEQKYAACSRAACDKMKLSKRVVKREAIRENKEDTMKKILAAFLSATMLLGLLAGCGGGSASSGAASSSSGSGAAASSGSGKEIVINYPTFQVGVNTSAPVISALVEGFNEKYAGQYKIVVEEVPGDANYAEKIQVMISTGSLPPVVYGGGYKLLDLALAQDLVVDLTPYVEADPEWKAQYNDASMAANARDGKIYASSMEGSLVGYFYNKDLFAQAGIDAAPKTWDEFFADCDKLIAAGITPMAMDTADGAWCSQLMMGAMIAASGDEGLAFMNTKYPTDYNQDVVVKAVEKLQWLYQNCTTLDAVGGAYENAANNFYTENVAIIANGPWMIGDFSDTTLVEEGFNEKVGVAAYPGGFVYDEPIEGMFVTKQSDPALEEAAIAMVRYFTSDEAQEMALNMQGMVPASPTAEISDEALSTFPLLGDFLSQAAECELRSPTFTSNMVPGLESEWSNNLPNLATGNISAADLCQILSNFAASAQ